MELSHLAAAPPHQPITGYGGRLADDTLTVWADAAISAHVRLYSARSSLRIAFSGLEFQDMLKLPTAGV